MKSTIPISIIPYKIRKMLGPSIYRIIYKLIDILRLWRYPADIDQTAIHSSRLNMIYWMYKWNKPITNPEKGSGLEAYFAEKRRQVDQSLLPESFHPEKSVAISAVGDLFTAHGIENSAGKLYASVEELIFDADISIANLESSLTKDPRPKYWTVNSSPEQFDVLKGPNGRQYTILQTGNNHILDRGMEGFNTTHDRLEAEGFLYMGTNRSPEAQKKALIINSNGLKFGFVAATYSVNNQPFPNGKDYLVNVIPFHHFRGKVDVSLLENQISYCKIQGCDFIIVSLHWGNVYEFYPRQDQVDIAHHLVEWGADAIIRHHAHIIQSFEFYQTRRDPHRIAPIFYGLGHLNTPWSQPHFALSLIVNFEVTKGQVKDTQKSLVERVMVTPVVQQKYDKKGAPYFQIKKLSEHPKSDHSSADIAYLHKVCQYADLNLRKELAKMNKQLTFLKMHRCGVRRFNIEKDIICKISA